MEFFIGCAVWSYKGWVGELFPRGTRQGDFLRLYSRRFSAVEGNTTFYATPNAQTVNRWVEHTPPEFQFCPKLPRDITHNGTLKPFIHQALEFAEIMRPLGSRLGPFFAQLPPSYHPKSIDDDLAVFLNAWQQTQLPIALEVRHPDWFRQVYQIELNYLLERLHIGRVILDTRPIYTKNLDKDKLYTADSDTEFTQAIQAERKKPQLPVDFSITAPFTIVRFISHPVVDVNIPFMQEWINQIQAWLQDGTQIYFFVHCPLEDFSPRNARFFQNLLEQNQIDVPSLPWNDLEKEQMTLDL